MTTIKPENGDRKKVVSRGKAGAQWWCEQNRHRLRRTNETLNFNPLFSSDELKVQTTPNAVTPFAGMASFFAWLRALNVPKRLGKSLFSHARWLRHDTAFRALLGVKRFPAEDAIRWFFHRFTQAHIEAFWPPLWRSMLELLEAPKAGGALSPPLIWHLF